MKLALWLQVNTRFLAMALVFTTLLSLAGCGDGTTPAVPDSVATLIIAGKCDVPVNVDPKSSGRLTFTNVKYEEKSGSDRTHTYKLWSEVQRTRSEDRNKNFTLQVTVHFASGADQQFTPNVELSAFTDLNLNQLNEMKGTVPEKLIVAIVAEKDNTAQ